MEPGKDRCPACGGGLQISQLTEEVPHFGKTLIIASQCPRCGFKHSSLLHLEAGEPSVHSARVTRPEHLQAKVVRSSTATIRIRELGVEIRPGPYAESFITNVEGVLERVENSARSMLALSEKPKEKERCRRFLRRLEEAKRGRRPFTLTLTDPLGSSAILAEGGLKVSRRRIRRFEG